MLPLPQRDIEPDVIARLRGELAAQIAAPLAISTSSTQYRFGEDFAAYCDIDIRLGETFAVVVCQGGLPSEEMIVRIWHQRADEVWLVDRSESVVSVIPREGVIRVFEMGETIRSLRLPQIAISVAALFGVTN